MIINNNFNSNTITDDLKVHVLNSISADVYLFKDTLEDGIT